MSITSKAEKSSKLPWQATLFVSTFAFIVDKSLRSNGTVNRFLLNLFDIKSPPSPKPRKNGVQSVDITVDPARNLWFRLYIPNKHTVSITKEHSESQVPVIFYFHGGGFVSLAANSKPYHDMCTRLARELHAVIVSVNYRLAPEHRFPSQYEDGFDVIKFIDERGFDGMEVNADLSQCFIAGDSAGGNLAHHVALKIGEDDTLKKVKVIGLIPIQPFFGGEERTEPETKLAGSSLVNVERTDWMWKAFLPEGSDREHPVVNVSGSKSKDLTEVKLPATVIFVGGLDPLKEWQKRYYEKMKESGKEVEMIGYPNAIHSFYAFPEIPESGLFVEEVRAFLHRQSLKIRENTSP